MTPSEQRASDYEAAKSKFLVYDKQSGSRWLNDEAILAFCEEEVRRAVEEARKHFYCEYCECHDCQKAEILSTARE